MSIYFNYVIYLNPKQIDKANKTLLDLRARCVGDRFKSPEAKSNPGTHSVKDQVGNEIENIIFLYVSGFSINIHAVYH